jgi:hypothetical protein
MSLKSIENEMKAKLIKQGFKTGEWRYRVRGGIETGLIYKQFVFAGISLQKRWFKQILCITIKPTGYIDDTSIFEAANKSKKIWYDTTSDYYNTTHYFIRIPVECVDKVVGFLDSYYKILDENNKRWRETEKIKKEEYDEMIDDIYVSQIGGKC